MKKPLIITAAIALLMGGGVAIDEAVITDEEWSEKIKAARLDDRSNEDLQEIITSHSSKFERRSKDAEMFEYPDYVKFSIRKELQEVGLTGAELDAEVEKEYEDRERAMREELVKLKDAVVLSEKELELRK